MSGVNTESRLAGMFRNFTRDILLEMHIHVPAKVTKVDYDKGFINGKPLVKIKYNEAKIFEQEEIQDVPITMLNFNNNNAFMTFPIAVGDLVYIVMSDRDTAHLINSDGNVVVPPEERTPFGAYPIGCLPFHTFTKTLPIDKENIVIKNKDSKITVGQGSVDIKTSGEASINGAKVTSDGDFITKDNVSLNNHRHNGGPVPDKP